MTNLKKTLAVVLAFAMILSMGAVSTFAAYSDVTAGTKVSEAVDILSGLNILTGFEDGTFKPEETVTRAQMAAIICRTLGYEDQAQSSMGSTIFNDVAADHWASGYINVAQAQQIINGYGDGNYGPEDKVTYEQAVKMIVSALGYDLAANAKGGYPTGYLAIASAEGITKSANGKVGDAATRGTIAVLVYNSLEVQLMDQSSWSTGSDGDKYAKIDETVLSKYLEVTKWEGIVTQTPATRIVLNKAYDSTKTAQAAIKGKYFYYYNDKLVETKYDTDDDGYADDYVVYADKVDTNGLLGKSVVAYIGEDDVTGNNTIFAIAENDNKNEVTKISKVQLVGAGERYYNDTANTIGYKEIGSTRIKDLDVAGATVLVNYETQSATTTQALANLLPRGGSIEFISNDADSDIEYIVATAYEREAVIETAENNNGVYKFDCYTGKLPKVDAEDEDSLVVVYKDGAIATVADLAANDTVSYVKLADGFEVMFASSATVTGVVDSYDPKEEIVTIAGTDYKLSVLSGLTAAKLSGEEGVFYLNVDGQIAHNETAPTAVGKYAFVVATYREQTGVDNGEYLQVVLADGTVAEYQISKTAKVVADDNTAIDASTHVEIIDDPSDNPIDNETEFKGFFKAQMSNNSGNTWKATAADIATYSNLLVKLTVSNDKVTKAKLLGGLTNTAISGNTYDSEAMSLGSLDFDDNTVVFSVKQTSGVIDPDDVKVGAVADFFVDEEAYTTAIRAYDMDANSSIYGALIGCGIVKSVTADDNVFVVISKKTTTYNDGDAYVVTGMKNGEVETYTIYDEDAAYTDDPSDLEAGDVLLLAEADADGIVSDIKKLVDAAKGSNATATLRLTMNVTEDVDALDQIYSGAGLVTSASKNKFAINAPIIENECVTACTTCPATGSCSSGCVVNNEHHLNSNHSVISSALTDLTYRSSANYTLVDYSENFKNPEVTLEDGSDYTFDLAYRTYAYVRYVDGKMSDVVVYRMAKQVAAPAITLNGTATYTVNDTVEIDCDTAGASFSVVVESGAGTATIADGEVKFTGAGALTFKIRATKSGMVAGESVSYTVTINAAS